MSGTQVIQGALPVGRRRVAVIASRFNDFVVSGLLKGAIGAWVKHGGAEADLLVARVPGAFELPVVAAQLARSGQYDAIVALGCVIRGETAHFDYVAGECARGLQDVSIQTGVPVAFGVLTTETVEQALQRAAPGGSNKGGEAMECALEMADLLAQLKSRSEGHAV
ncbi:MAG: 6,7-dimethyl-8-ribityllumazine synthase [Steroidobacteraceae bacterium]|nr:6,7-dimethyl-8-ribityllumazine synthase [Steroidobacteraceae bacterium]